MSLGIQFPHISVGPRGSRPLGRRFEWRHCVGTTPYDRGGTGPPEKDPAGITDLWSLDAEMPEAVAQVVFGASLGATDALCRPNG